LKSLSKPIGTLLHEDAIVIGFSIFTLFQAIHGLRALSAPFDRHPSRQMFTFGRTRRPFGYAQVCAGRILSHGKKGEMTDLMI
jgi:hypothetical protein